MIEIILGISMLFNALQYVANDDLSEKINQVQSVNASNSKAVSEFSQSLDQCSERIAKWKRKESEWQIQSEKTEVKLDELETNINDSDWGDCRVPVDMEI
jgi:TolA-binding protein